MAINKVIYGNQVLIDLTEDNVVESDVRSGVIAHGGDGATLIGTARMIYNSTTEELNIPGWAVTLTDG